MIGREKTDGEQYDLDRCRDHDESVWNTRWNGEGLWTLKVAGGEAVSDGTSGYASDWLAR